MDVRVRDYKNKVIAQLMRYGAPISYAGENMEPPETLMRGVIVDLSFLKGSSVNDGMLQDYYIWEKKLTWSIQKQITWLNSSNSRERAVLSLKEIFKKG